MEINRRIKYFISTTMTTLKNIEENVFKLLLKYPQLRTIYQRKKAIFKYWQEYEGIKTEITEGQFIKLTNPETISRAIRKVLNTHPEFRPSPEAEQARYEQAEEFRNHYQFDSNTYIEILKQDPQRHIQIIGLYWQYKHYTFENKDQAGKALKRDMRAASNLTPYSNERIIEVMDWLEANVNFKWTLETIFKYINEDLDELTAKMKYNNKNYENY